jgi:DNA gyrase/topoisomerase IV subunit A
MELTANIFLSLQHLFNPHDTPLLIQQKEDNQKIEPMWYCPIIPMVLVNGADGIGTGWMTKIPNYNPREIIANIKKMIKGEKPSVMVHQSFNDSNYLSLNCKAPFKNIIFPLIYMMKWVYKALGSDFHAD